MSRLGEDLMRSVKPLATRTSKRGYHANEFDRAKHHYKVEKAQRERWLARKVKR